MSNPSGHILIVDDEASLRQTLTRILHQSGWEVTSAENGTDALRLMAGCNYDLAYLDIRLPDMDGIQVLGQIRQLYPKMQVIFLTAHASLSTALEALRLGATDYLIKPVDPEVLVARTRIILREQAVERRKQEIQEQIEVLSAELEQLETENQPVVSSPAVSPSSPDRFIKRGSMVLDLKAQKATFGELVLSLPPATFSYLAVLARHSPEVVPYQTLVNEAQGYQASLSEARELSKYHVHVLRQVIEQEPQVPEHVLNVRGVGYRLLVD